MQFKYIYLIVKVSRIFYIHGTTGSIKRQTWIIYSKDTNLLSEVYVRCASDIH